MGAHNVSEASKAEGQLTEALSKFMLVVENYPDLKANQNFPLAAGNADQHRKQDRLLAAGLQRPGAVLQQQDPDVPVQYRCRDVQLYQTRLLRDLKTKPNVSVPQVKF
jgi:hypothetical protein